MIYLKRFIAVFISIIVLVTPAFAGSTYSNGDVIVYVTRTGECYHREGCSYLKSKIEITLQRAVQKGYRACSRCNPPRLIEDSSSNSYMERSSSGNFIFFSTPKPTATPRATSTPRVISTPRPTATPTPKKPTNKSLGIQEAAGILVLVIFLYPMIKEILIVPIYEIIEQKRESKKQEIQTINIPKIEPENQIYVYVSANGSVYHKICGCSRAYRKIDLKYAKEKGYRPCKICAPVYSRPYHY